MFDKYKWPARTERKLRRLHAPQKTYGLLDWLVAEGRKVRGVGRKGDDAITIRLKDGNTIDVSNDHYTLYTQQGCSVYSELLMDVVRGLNPKTHYEFLNLLEICLLGSVFPQHIDHREGVVEYPFGIKLKFERIEFDAGTYIGFKIFVGGKLLWTYFDEETAAHAVIELTKHLMK